MNGKTAGLFAAVAGLAATAALSGPSAVAGPDSAERTNNDLYGMGLSNHKFSASCASARTIPKQPG